VQRQQGEFLRRRLRLVVALAAFAVVLALVLSIVALQSKRSPSAAELAAKNAEAASLAARRTVARLDRRVATLEAETAALSARLKSTQTTVAKNSAGLTPLAKRVLKSVFTIEAGPELGSGFAAWTTGGDLYLVTANHVIANAGSSFVNVTKNTRSWQGEIAATDPANDLALVRVAGTPAGAAPLWQSPERLLPATGDELLLVGSPYGLEGTVTTGIVSRVTDKVIQTDAAANPGNSGGPAIDKDGRIVGVLVAGGAQNLNFAVPIGRVCVKLRKC
jgi:S1-C subfamily serine protease